MNKASYLLVVYISVFSLIFIHMAPAYAGVVGTHQLLNEFSLEQDRANLLDIVSYEDAQILLEQNGVTSEQAQERINAMTDAEVQMYAQNFGNLPAGGVGSAAAILILILLILVLALR